VRLRKTLTKRGLDAGADTIAADPAIAKVPAGSTIWRILIRLRLRHRWQADVSHWHLAHGGGIEILNILDDHSRLAIANLPRRTIGGPNVVNTFTTAFTRWAPPPRCSPTTGTGMPQSNT
jgi:hypothetical protein